MKESYFNYEKMIAEINTYMNKYSFLAVTGICESILGCTIPAVILGEGKIVITYIGGEEGYDLISPSVLLRFVKDICSLYEGKGSAFGFSAENIFKNYTLVIIPMLNPDGAGYCCRGVDENNPLRERVLKLNDRQNDFSHWRGNARGVELKYNYGLENGEYESEPEVGALCNFFRYGMTPQLLIEFSQNNELKNNDDGIIFFGEGEIENKMAIALSQMTMMRRTYRESALPRLMLTDWAIKELGASAFSVDMPCFECNSRKQFEDISFSYYTKIRKMLFCTPFLTKIKS